MAYSGSTLRYNYVCTCGGDPSYGKKIYLSSDFVDKDKPIQPSIEELRSRIDGSQDKKKPLQRDSQEESKRRLQHLEKAHKESLKEKEDTIVSLREIISQHEQRVLELESKTDGNISAHQNRTGSNTRDSPTQKLLDQIERLQKDKEELLLKVAEHDSKDASFAQISPRTKGNLSNGVGSGYQMGSCTTDTEKELENMKRDKYFFDKEIKILREENKQLRSSLASLGVDPAHIEIESKVKIPIPENVLSTEEIMSSNNLNGHSRASGEVTNSVHIDGGGVNGLVLSSLESQMKHLQKELDRKSTELSKAEAKLIERNSQEGEARDELVRSVREEMQLEINRLNEELGNLRQVVGLVYKEFSEVKTAYLALRDEAKSLMTTQGFEIVHMQKQMKQYLTEINSKNSELIEKYLREMKLRKKYHNELVELRGNIRVFCRVRPWIKEDGLEEDEIVVSIDQDDDSLVKVNNKGRVQMFDLDKVFGMDSEQSQVFEEVSALVRSVIDGFNVCIFAYGQTGSGKTYTMEGPKSNPGINQRALQLLFEDTADSNWQYEINASVIEIYNEIIRDLLNPDPDNKLEVKMHPDGGFHVPGLKLVQVSSLEDVNKVFETGRKNRATACTNMNEHSSRSHCLLCVTVKGFNPTTGSSSFGRLNLVDLAGSERVGKSHADGARLKEAQSINKSLACLGDVIHALRNKHGHVPYRNSKLTYLLQESLSGDSKTLMIVQVAPVEKNVSETACTLSFGQRVRMVELGTATKHVDGIKTTPTNAKRPGNLQIPTNSASSSPVTSPQLGPKRSPLTLSASSPLLNGRKKSSTSSPSSTPPSTPVTIKKSSSYSKTPTSPPESRKVSQTLKTSSSPLTRSNTLPKSPTAPLNLSGRGKWV